MPAKKDIIHLDFCEILPFYLKINMFPFYGIPLTFRFSNNSFFPTRTPRRRQRPFPPCRPPENFWIWIQKNPSFYCPPWELFRRLRKRWGFCVYVKVGCFVAWLLCCCMFFASFNVAAYCLWSFDCWRLSRFLFVFLSLFFSLLLLLLWLWWWWWWCFLFARNTFFSIGISERYLVYAMYAVVCPSGIIRLIPCSCRHIILSQLSFLFHWLIIQLATFFL